MIKPIKWEIPTWTTTKVSRATRGKMNTNERPSEQPKDAPRGLGCTAVVMPLVPMALGELFSPVKCETAGCMSPAWLIWMTQDEYDTAKGQTERHPIGYVFEKRTYGNGLYKELYGKEFLSSIKKELTNQDIENMSNEEYEKYVRHNK